MMPTRALKRPCLSRRWGAGAAVVADMVVVADAGTVIVVGIMVHVIGTGVVGTDTITAAIGMPSRGGRVCTPRPTMVPTIMPQGNHGIQEGVAATGQDAATRIGAGPATIVAA